MIETKRLIIREIESTETDLNALNTLLSDKEVNKYLPWYPMKDINDTKKFYKEHIKPYYKENDGYYFVICLKENNHPIGYIAASGSESHDFGYGLQKEHWGKGIVTEASEAVIDFLKIQGWAFITATHDIDNIGSGKVMQKNGMSYNYSYKEQWQPKDIKVTFRMYQLNFDENQDRVYMEYWDKYPEHFIEDL